MEKHYNLSEKKASQVVNFEDRRRVSLYKKLGKIDYDDPSLYHLVLNMNRIDMDTALKLVCEMVTQKWNFNL